MIPRSVLVFDLYGDLAQFRKYFTNMSPMSFSLPPRTVLAGIVGAILGIGKDENPECFSRDMSFFGLRIMHPVKKLEIPQNYIKTSGSMNDFFNLKQHKPTIIEFLKDVRYRIYITLTEKHDALKSLLQNHQSTYTICLGISACLANFDYIGEYSVTSHVSAEYIDLKSVVPLASVLDIDFSGTVNLQKATVPLYMKNDRVVMEYSEILYEQYGNSMRVKLADEYYLVEELNDLIHEY